MHTPWSKVLPNIQICVVADPESEIVMYRDKIASQTVFSTA